LRISAMEGIMNDLFGKIPTIS